MALFANEIRTWALRGQTTQEAGASQGEQRCGAGDARTPAAVRELVGSGMSNMSFNGSPIDSNWVGTYLDQGWFGVVLDAALLLVLLLTAATTRARSPQRAIALFLVMYCMFASITETGLSDPSPYLLDLAVAASLLLPSRSEVAGMKVVIAHSRYRSSAPSGENLVVDQEAAALRGRRPRGDAFERRSDDIGSWARPSRPRCRRGSPQSRARPRPRRDPRARPARRAPRAQHFPPPEPVGAACVP